MIISSDPHFDHENMFYDSLRCRRFKNIGEMNRVILKNWFKKCKKGSTLVLLGDIFNFHFIADFIDRKIILVLGNHDLEFIKGLLQLKTTIKFNDLDITIVGYNEDVYPVKFSDLPNVTIIKEKYIRVCGGFVYLSHEPLMLSDMSPNTINIHGHIHPGSLHPDMQPLVSYANGGRYYNATVDYNNFQPVTIQEVYKNLGLASGVIL